MTDRPRLLDLYCGEGGAARGYVKAGFDVWGVDIRFLMAYANCGAAGMAEVIDISLWDIDTVLRICKEFQAIHASPPCQHFTELNNDKSRHPNLIPHTRQLLLATGLPYVIENVRAAKNHLISPVSLFGQMFDCHMVTSSGQRFDLSRERCFETNWYLWPPPVRHVPMHPIANVYGGHLRARSGKWRTGNGTGRTRDFIGEDKPALARQLMDMPWATMAGMSEAVPPAYTYWIGRQLMGQIR